MPNVRHTKCDVVTSDWSSISVKKDGEKLYEWIDGGESKGFVFGNVKGEKQDLIPAKLEKITVFFKSNLGDINKDSVEKLKNAKALNEKIKKHNAKADSFFYKLLKYIPFLGFNIEHIDEVDLGQFPKQTFLHEALQNIKLPTNKGVDNFFDK